MTAVIVEGARSGALALSDLLGREPAPLSASEAEAIVRDFVAREIDRWSPAQARTAVRACRCDRPWVFEPGHCGKCGHDLKAVAR